MKVSELSFIDGFFSDRGRVAKKENKPFMVFDWDKAASIIKDRLSKQPDLVAEAGLQRDWDCTGGIIFEKGKPVSDSYTYLCSNWAVPTLILSWGGDEQEAVACWLKESDCRFNEESKWDDNSLSILGVKL